jgi:hypothetical protein
MTTLLRYLGNSITAVIGLMAVIAILLLGITALIVLIPRRTATANTGVVVKSLGPTTHQLQRLGELASLRLNIVDVLQAEGQGHRGLWLIKGDALLACDMTRAEIVDADEAAKTAVVRLVNPRCVSPRVDHEKTKTWNIEKSTWLPWKWGDKDELREAAMYHAQKLVEEAARSPHNIGQAQSNAELLVRRTYEMVGWHVTVEWRDD